MMHFESLRAKQIYSEIKQIIFFSENEAEPQSQLDESWRKRRRREEKGSGRRGAEGRRGEEREERA